MKGSATEKWSLLQTATPEVPRQKKPPQNMLWSHLEAWTHTPIRRLTVPIPVLLAQWVLGLSLKQIACSLGDLVYPRVTFGTTPFAIGRTEMRLTTTLLHRGLWKLSPSPGLPGWNALGQELGVYRCSMFFPPVPGLFTLGPLSLLLYPRLRGTLVGAPNPTQLFLARSWRTMDRVVLLVTSPSRSPLSIPELLLPKNPLWSLCTLPRPVVLL